MTFRILRSVAARSILAVVPLMAALGFVSQAVPALAGPAALQSSTSVGSEVVRGTAPAATELAQRQQALSQWLVDRAGALSSAPAVVELPEEERQRLAEAVPAQGRLRVGSVLSVGLKIHATGSGSEGADVGQELPFGWLRSDGQEHVWTGIVRSPGATGLRLHLGNVRLPPAAELYVYSTRGEAFGPYTGRGPNQDGEVWTHTILGDEIRLQLHWQAQAEGQLHRTDRSPMVIREVLHLGENFLLGRMAQENTDDKAFCNFNASCIENAACSTIPAAITAARNGMAHLQFVVGGGGFICSGGLLNDTDGSTQIPYLLTANHCFDTQASATSLEAYFQFTTSCGGSCSLGGSVPRTVGSTLLASAASSDYTLVQLSQNPPAGSVLVGWNSAAVANSNGTQLYRISHPAGAPQAYSEQQVDTSAGTCGGIPRGAWIYSSDNFGATEGGSSGSPVLNASGQVVGQLTGACGLNPSNPCSALNATIDGALAAYFASVSAWLDPVPVGDPIFSDDFEANNLNKWADIFP